MKQALITTPPDDGLPELTVENIVLVNHYYYERTAIRSGNRRECHLLGYQLSGEYLHTFPNRQINFVKDTLLFIHKDCPYQAKTVIPGYSISFYFSTKEEFAPLAFGISAAEAPRLRQTFLHAYNTYMTAPKGWREQLFSDLYRVLSIYRSMQSPAYTPSSEMVKWEEAISFIRKNYAEKITLADISRILGVGERRTRDLFLLHQNQSFSEYLTAVRMGAAADLLKTGAYPVNEVAALCGFSDVFYFSKCFKKHLGVPPSAYGRME